MVAETSEQEGSDPRSSAWAPPVSKLIVHDAPTGAVNLNVQGRRLVGPLQGFGQLWQKSYSVALDGSSLTPTEIIQIWKANFSRFWPTGCRFYAPLTGITPGEVALINLPLVPHGAPLSTGILVIYADDESFSFMTPEGHMFAGMITFSAEMVDGVTVAKAQVLIRANDPLWEIVSRVYAFRREDWFWTKTLEALSRHVGVETAVRIERICIDPRFQWSQAGNVRHNAAIRSTVFAMFGPYRWVKSKLALRRTDV